MIILVWTAPILAVFIGATSWLAAKASTISSSLRASSQVVAELKDEVVANDKQKAIASAKELRRHTEAAREASEDPLWRFAANIPGLGANFAALTEVARSADDISVLGVTPLVNIFDSLNWDLLLPQADGSDFGPLVGAAPVVSNAADAVKMSAERLESIDEDTLLSQVAEPLVAAREQLRSVSGTISSAADAAHVLPAMLGAHGERDYLLMIQNNAESRASGGIPGALAILSINDGKLALGTQSSAGEIGVMEPALPVEREQQQIYSSRLGRFMQDINLTPDFPTGAEYAQAMWERKMGQRVDGVLSIDPVALSYILQSTGPVELSSEFDSYKKLGLPSELNGQNVVRTLLSDVYEKIDQPELQDVYFAAVAQQIFTAISEGGADAKSLIAAVSRGAEEGRVLVWSSVSDEQSVLTNYKVSGSIAGSSISPAEFGVYFNDGTGAKMDYYVKRTVQLIKECPKDGYEQTTVRVISTNDAPADAATSLPAYVTGDGIFGVPPGSVQTNIVAYGPVQAHVESAKLDGQKTGFAPHIHGNRPVGILAVRLAPGESRTVEFTFGKIVQHTEPNVVVTPTVQDVKDVTLPTEMKTCG
ncbi:hypothetical protein Asphe3_30690 [Pseudarthrobacter phenanthrenivorans Sphe3]|uniref:DUF4012 domain-containing protein n=1 Tax=Pseudarthrobacter phenanthrenivorans (strain DSM 18606 / JCM 16027 / LMG 23796 / Sphe3) TaxID=930171 RepID=F0M1I3_PSEPM|nr:hypothetical protein Asphe3_30690 [Pseudarthrobacter phenanthrenivorans Sphe3]